MSDEQRISPIVSRWLKVTSTSPYGTKDGVSRVMARVSGVQQRRRWWRPSPIRRTHEPQLSLEAIDLQPVPVLATNGHTPTIIGRTQTMFSPVKAIAAGALVFAIGGALLITAPLDEQASPPGAATDAPPIRPLEFTGSMWHGDPVRPSTSEDGEGVDRERGGAHQLELVRMSDPRLQGTMYVAANSDWHTSTDATTAQPTELWVWSKSFRIENDGGAWQELPTIAFDTLGSGDPSGWTSVFLGEGGYEGLYAVADVDYDPDAGRWDLRGYIIEGEPPAAPEPYRTAEQTE